MASVEGAEVRRRLMKQGREKAVSLLARRHLAQQHLLLQKS